MDDRYRTGPGHMNRLGNMKDLKVASDSPDIRGWNVATTDDHTIGTVDDLIVDTQAMKARYLLVDLNPGRSADIAHDDDRRQVLLPVERAQVDARGHVVRIDMAAANLEMLPPFGGSVPTGYDDDFGRVAPHTGIAESRSGEQRITRADEELRIGRREVPAGEVTVSKHVETEHVREPVERMREDVRVERRPVTESSERAELRDDEVRVPISEEEVVVEKRPVTKEEIVITKEAHKETGDIEADLKKERVDVDRHDNTKTSKASRRRE